MKKLLKIYITITLLTGLAVNSYAATVYDWTGAVGTNWTTSKNWSVNSVQQTTSYPGDPARSGSNTDIVQFGVTIYYSFAQRPILSPGAPGTSITVAAVNIGDNSADNNAQVDINIDIEGTLNVTGTILQMHSNNTGKAGDGSINFPLGYNYHIQTWVYGSGFINAGSIQIGDNTLPTDGINNITRFNFGDSGNSGVKGLTTVVSGDFIVNSMTRNDATNANKITAVSNANAGINGGTLTINGQLKLINTGTINYATSQFQPQARFTMGAFNNGGTTTLNLKGANALTVTSADPTTHQYGSDFFDFYLVDRNAIIAGSTSNLGKTIVNYCGTVDQEVYTSNSFPVTSVLDNDGGNYNYLTFSGSGTKKIDATPSSLLPLSVSADITLAAGTETVDLNTNNPTLLLNNSNMVFISYGSPNYNYTIPKTTNIITASGTTFNNGSIALTIPGTVTNAGTINNGTGALTFGGAVTNSGTINEANTGAINFNNTFNNSIAAALFNQTAGTINFNNSYSNTGTFKSTAGIVNFNQSGNQSLVDNSVATPGSVPFPAAYGSTFYQLNILNGGTKTMSGSGQFYVASNGFLTMGGASTLDAGGVLTLKSDVTGTATLTAVPSNCVLKGNATVQRYVTANRAYRLVSSPVYTGTDGSSNNIYGVTYLRTNTYLTGTGSGFDKVGNPTLYLYRENMSPLTTSFLNSNYRGISDISGTPYSMNDTDYPTTNIPVGNGLLFYFRGSKKQATLAQLTVAGAAATNDTLNTVGVLNTGNITVHDWYTPASANLGYTKASTDSTIWGMNLVGNPYASTIDWDQYVSGGIIKSNVTKFSYKLIPTGAQGSGNYDIYAAGTPADASGNKYGTQGTPKANLIASGEGFFVQATSNGPASLTFTEAAKSNTAVTGTSLYMSTSAIATATPQYIRLQMAMDSINTDGIIINFNDAAKTTFDANEDARYRVGTGKVNLASLSSDKVVLAINEMPLNTKGQTIALKVNAAANGTYSLNTKEITGIPQILDVWLKDAFTKDSVNMRNTKTYSFTIALADTNTFGTNRFSIVLRQNPVLAYQLLSFDAQKTTNKQVQLVWKTANEQNYTHFTVERSTDAGKTFDVVGSLNSSDEGTYSLLDKAPLTGANIYRLKQVDFNNNTTYSQTVQIDFTATATTQAVTTLNVYPNPVVNTVNVTIDTKSQVAGMYNIRITNSTGFVVKQVTTSQTSWQENVSGLFTGTYLVQVVNNKDNSLVGQTKFVKL